ncbi:MFS transporter [Paludibacterium yongneupense]|uniref:MFS transporter n=1 Tax=Paludibacterium yongneupense TaxID=400061 RepID=UPI0004214026|nr:MFS transporter [Paludibacterium yongneupense]
MPFSAALKRITLPYRGLPTAVYIQVVCCLIINMGGMAKLFLPLYLHESYGVDFRSVGLMISAYGAGSLLGSYKGGALSDRFDPRMLARVFLTLSGLCLVLLGTALPLPAFLPVLLVAGIADGAFRPVNQRLALEPCTEARRPVAQGMLRVATNLGVALSGITGGLLASVGYHWVYLSDGVSALLAVIWMVWAYRRHPAPGIARNAPSRHEVAGRQGPWRDGVFLRLMLALMIATAIFDQTYTTLGLFLRRDYQLDPRWLGYLFTLNGLMVVFLQVPIAHRMQAWGMGRCAALGVFLNGAGYCVLNFGNGPLWGILMMIAITFGELLLSPSLAQLVMLRSEGRQRGRYMGVYSAVWSGRTLYAPALGTWIYASAGGAMLWWVCGLASIAALAVQSPAINAILHPQPTPADCRP